MSMHKGLIGQSKGGASVKQDVTLKDYIERKTDNRGELGSWPFNLNASTTKDYTKDLEWAMNLFSFDPLPEPHIINRALHLQGNGEALVLLPNGHWYMSDTSGA